jgi:hypothetical protein
VNYGRFVDFKDQLGFFEFYYELPVANHAKKNRAPIFLRKYAFFERNTKFVKLDVEDFSTIQFFFLCSEVLEGWATKRILQKRPFSSHPIVEVS